MRFQVEGKHERVEDCPTAVVLLGMEHGVDGQEQLPGTQWRAGTVAADEEAEQAMLDRVPFGQGVMMPVPRSASYGVNERASGAQIEHSSVVLRLGSSEPAANIGFARFEVSREDGNWVPKDVATCEATPVFACSATLNAPTAGAFQVRARL